MISVLRLEVPKIDGVRMGKDCGLKITANNNNKWNTFKGLNKGGNLRKQWIYCQCPLFWNKTETWPAKGLAILGLERTLPFGESFQSIFQKKVEGEREEKEERRGEGGKNEWNEQFSLPRTKCLGLPTDCLRSTWTLWSTVLLCLLLLQCQNLLVCPVGHTCHCHQYSAKEHRINTSLLLDQSVMKRL